MKWQVTALVAGMIIMMGAAGEPDYRAEIEMLVVDPCYLDIIQRKESLESVPLKQTLAMMKLLQAESINRMYEVLIPVVVGKTAEARMLVYEFGKNQCIEGARKNQ